MLNQSAGNINEEKKVYTYDDLVKLDSTEIYNSVGKMYLSTKPTAPMYGFGTQERSKMSKMYYNKEIAKLDCGGNSSPGPTYQTREADRFYYFQQLAYKFDRAKRKMQPDAKYDYYHRKDIDFEPIQADSIRRKSVPVARIGLEQRFASEYRSKQSPGPQYNPSLKPEIENAPKYSFGYKRDLQGQSPLAAQGATPVIVGPGTYLQSQKIPNTSQLPNEPKYSFTKGPKFALFSGRWDKNQTYDARSFSIGDQTSSKKRTEPSYSIGKARRDIQTGQFKDLMVKVPQRLKLDHIKI